MVENGEIVCRSRVRERSDDNTRRKIEQFLATAASDKIANQKSVAKRIIDPMR